MMFRFPKKRIGERCWFIHDSKPYFGTILQYTVVGISSDECRVWYNIEYNRGSVAVNEEQVMDDAITVPSPKYNVGDEVSYMYLTKDKASNTDFGIISKIEMVISSMHQIDILYFFEEDGDDFWVNEDDIEVHIIPDEFFDSEERNA